MNEVEQPPPEETEHPPPPKEAPDDTAPAPLPLYATEPAVSVEPDDEHT